MGTHTPGPWKWEPMSEHMLGLGRDVPYDGTEDSITDPGGVMICGCSRCKACVERGASCFCPEPADQHLIAAAPDLLAACKEALVFISKLGPGQCPDGAEDEVTNNWKRLRSVIAKAEGTNEQTGGA